MPNVREFTHKELQEAGVMTPPPEARHTFKTKDGKVWKLEQRIATGWKCVAVETAATTPPAPPEE